MNALCDFCNQRESNHVYGHPDNPINACCHCHVYLAHSPADWHPECMKALETFDHARWLSILDDQREKSKDWSADWAEQKQQYIAWGKATLQPTVP